MANENRNINQEVDQLREDLKEIRNDLAALLQTARDAGLEQGRAAGERVRNYSQQTQTRAREGLESARNSVESEIEERPLTSALTAFGIGFVVGMLLDRRR